LGFKLAPGLEPEPGGRLAGARVREPQAESEPEGGAEPDRLPEGLHPEGDRGVRGAHPGGAAPGQAAHSEPAGENQGYLLNAACLAKISQKESQVAKMQRILQMILDSRTDIETWFLEAYYEVKQEVRQQNKDASAEHSKNFKYPKLNALSEARRGRPRRNR